MREAWSAEMCSGSEAGSYLRLIDFVYHPTLGLSVINKKKNVHIAGPRGIRPAASSAKREIIQALGMTSQFFSVPKGHGQVKPSTFQQILL